MSLSIVKQKQAVDILEDHKRVVQQMAQQTRALGDAGVRGVQLFAAFAGIVGETEAAASKADNVAELQGIWAANKSHLVKAIDATAAGLGVTRQSLLDELAALPATDFGV